ncbi:MAG: hypothetical protein U1E29_09740, partial [Coriobacteriia bacterium]|nr:hypothetical protein [Coriobacteriia bacterium]
MMDTRLYILAGTFALVVLSLIALVVSLIRARRAPLQPLVPEPGPWPALMPAPASVIEMHVAESTPFT